MLKNSQAIPLSSVAVDSFPDFRDSLITAVDSGARVVSLFAQPETDPGAGIVAVLADDVHGRLRLLRTRVETSFPSLTPQCPQVHLSERVIWEEQGIEPFGHPWLKSVRRHGAPDDHPFFVMAGREVHEVAVGPVHAGVIEPGHFRFQCTGETVQHLEIQLGYQHRGIERALVGGPGKRTLNIIETAAGDTTVGHTTAYCQAVEALSRTEVPERAQALRIVALEIERLANHVGDIGALAGDVGFLPAAAFCGRLRGDFLNLTTTLTGSRMGRGLVRPGGVAFDAGAEMVEELRVALRNAEADTHDAVDLFFASRSTVERLRGTGPLLAQACRELGIVGVAARAGGLARDARADHPAGGYERMGIVPAVADSGDVFARAQVRQQEILSSFAVVNALLASLPDGPVMACSAPMEPDNVAVSLVEGWRGEVAHVAITDATGHFADYRIVDPSFHNWHGLAMAMRGQQIFDFPLCNKSFNLSYSGFDL